MMEPRQIVGCAYCKHRIDRTARCDAFPDGIPFLVLSGQIAHTRPIDGDHGIRFEPADKWDGYLVYVDANESETGAQ